MSQLRPIPRRLDKYLADATALSRSQIARAWEQGRIAVERHTPDTGGSSELALWSLIFADDCVLLDGQAVAVSPPDQYHAFYKPAGVLTAARDPYGRACLERWLDDLPDRVFPVGRLDRQTTGLLLLTDDGDLAHALLEPRFHVAKTYALAVSADDEGAIGGRLDALVEGVTLEDGPAAALAASVMAGPPAQVEVLDAPGRLRWLSVVVDEGRKHLVRRLAHAVGFELVHLHRTSFGPLAIDELRPGERRPLSDATVDALWSAVGGRARIRRRQIDALRRRAERWRAQGRPHPRLDAWLARCG